MVLLIVAKPTVTVATDRDCVIPESLASDVMELKGQGIVVAAKDTARIIAPETFESALFAPLSVQFKLVHVPISSNDNAIDVLEALIVSGCEPIESVWAGLEDVSFSGDIGNAHAFELAKAGRIVRS